MAYMGVLVLLRVFEGCVTTIWSSQQKKQLHQNAYVALRCKIKNDLKIITQEMKLKYLGINKTSY